MQLFGINYYVSYNPETTELANSRPELTEIASSALFTFYEVADADLVEVASYTPSVYEGPHNSLPAGWAGYSGLVRRTTGPPSRSSPSSGMDGWTPRSM